MVLTFYMYAVVGSQLFAVDPEVITELETDEDYLFYISNTVGGF